MPARRSIRKATASPGFRVACIFFRFFDGVDRLVVDRQDHVAFSKPISSAKEFGSTSTTCTPPFSLIPEVSRWPVGQVLDRHAEAHRGAFLLACAGSLPLPNRSGKNLGQVADHHLVVLALAVAQHRDVQRVAHRRSGHHVDQLVAVVNRLAVDGHDDVALLDAGLLRRPARAPRSATNTPSVAPLAFSSAGVRGSSDGVNEMPMEPRVTLPFLMISL